MPRLGQIQAELIRIFEDVEGNVQGNEAAVAYDQGVMRYGAELDPETACTVRDGSRPGFFPGDAGK